MEIKLTATKDGYYAVKKEYATLTRFSKVVSIEELRKRKEAEKPTK